MQTELITGAAGGIGTRLRHLLKGAYPNVRLSDVRLPADLSADESFVEADLASMAQVDTAVAGVDGIVHLGGFSVEGPWDTILQANIVGCYNLFEAARRHRVERVVFASSNHVVGFYPRQRRIGIDAALRPDSRYGVSKAFGEAVARAARHLHPYRQFRRCAGRPAATLDLDCPAGPPAAHPYRPRASGDSLRNILRRLRQCTRLVG